MLGVGSGVGRANGDVCGGRGGGGGGGGDVLRSRLGGTSRRSTQQENSESFMSGEGSLPLPPMSGGRSIDSTGSDSRRDMVEQAGIGAGLEVYCPPPDDMMEFLRGMSWWEEGLIQVACAG
ncbi:unnamed protein product [Laminaria digitata]